MFDPNQLLMLADELCARGKELGAGDALECETCFRTCVNRAYYAAFLTARDKAGLTQETRAVHTKVINHFKKHDPSVSNNLRCMKKYREQADYILSQELKLGTARKAMRLAYKIIKDCK